MKKKVLLFTLIIIAILAIMTGCYNTRAVPRPTNSMPPVKVVNTHLPTPVKQTSIPVPQTPNPTPTYSLRSDDGRLRRDKTISQKDGAVEYINEHELFSLIIPEDWWDYIIVRECQIPNLTTFYFYGYSMIGQGDRLYDSISNIELFSIYQSDSGEIIGELNEIKYSVTFPEANYIDIFKVKAKNKKGNSSSIANVQGEKEKVDSDIEQLIVMVNGIDGVLSSFKGVTRQEIGWSYICVRNLIDSLWNEYMDYELIIGDTVYTSYDECRSDDDLNRRLRVDKKDLNRLIDKMTLNVLNENGEIVETKTYYNVFIYLKDSDIMFDNLDDSAFDAQFLWISNCSAKSDISNIEKFNNLEQLYIDECDYLYDISAISKLTKLRELSLGGTHINSYIKYDSIESLANLTMLEKLNLAYVSLPDVSPLANLTNLKILDFTMAYDLEDISHLRDLSKLKKLSLIDTNITDISALANLDDLQVVLLFDLYLDDDWQEYLPEGCMVHH